MRRLDVATLAGLACALVMIVLAHRLEGGSLAALAQPSAALVVLGGTLGAVLLAHPLSDVRRAFAALGALAREPVSDERALVDEFVHLGQVARRDGIIALEEPVGRLEEPFLRRALMLVVDGVDAKNVAATLELELADEAERGEAVARVFDTAGGTAPTLGILGAVLGLIQVLSTLTDAGGIGPGIAVAFVATLYGVGTANLLFLPAAAKLRARQRRALRRHELIAHGALAIQQGEHPRLIADKLAAFEPRGARFTLLDGGKSAA
jgi:chemotaxis protein MotA